MEKQHILVVEDHGPLLAAIQHVLELENYSVMTAIDGLEALELMKQVRPDMIIADIMMPRMDGYDLYKAVRARPDWVPIPFIFLTARSEKEDMLKGKSMGVEDYIIKPFDPQELLIAVQARLGRAQAIQEATEASFEQLKQQIINTLSHELRTPLTYIQGYTALALESPPSAEDFKDFLLSIKRGADRLTRLVEDMLLLVRLDTGQAADEFQVLSSLQNDLGEVVKRTVRQHEGQASEQGVKLEVELADDLPATHMSEPFFVDALDRLLNNAIRFCRYGEQWVKVTTRANDNWIEIAVQDNGIGIAADQIPHLFERFRQIDREEMEQQGAGLGLSIAQQLIKLHDGKILVESKLGEGSTFTIRLPIAEAKSSEK